MAKRKNCFDKHKDGARILKAMKSGEILPAEAARLLKCSKSNVSQYIKRHNLKIQGKLPLPPTKKPQSLNLTKSSKKPRSQKNPTQPPDKPINEMADHTLQSASDQLKYLSPTDIKELQQLLMDQIHSGEITVDFDQFIALSKEIFRYYALQLKHNLTNKQEDQIIKLDDKDVQELLAKIEEVHCNTCQYRQHFMQNRNSETETERLVSE